MLQCEIKYIFFYMDCNRCFTGNCGTSLVSLLTAHDKFPGGITLAAIATHFSVACCLSHSCPLPKLFNGFTWWGPWPPGKGKFRGRTPSQNMQLQIAAATWRIRMRIRRFRLLPITFVLVIITTMARDTSIIQLFFLHVAGGSYISKNTFVMAMMDWQQL